jgi:protein-S-isoprenylcysteine O-methyltransferase Ste14
MFLVFASWPSEDGRSCCSFQKYQRIHHGQSDEGWIFFKERTTEHQATNNKLITHRLIKTRMIMKPFTINSIFLLILFQSTTSFTIPHGKVIRNGSHCHFAEISSDELLNAPIRSKTESNVSSSTETSPLILGASKALDRTWKKSKQYMKSIFSEDFGSRGELFVFAQLFCTYAIGVGYIPLLKHFVEILLGPVLFTIGLFVSLSSVVGMNKAFTAYSIPVSKQQGGQLITTGAFKYVRHPIYAGNLAILMGFSMMKDSAVRLLFTAIYYKLVDMKSNAEEKEMMRSYGKEYEDYKNRVQHKFLPWTKLRVIMSVNKAETKETTNSLSIKAVNGDHTEEEGSKQQKKRLYP